MKTKIHLILAALAFVVFSASQVWATRAIGVPTASPDAVFSNEATLVTVTAQVAVDVSLISSSINVIRLNQQGQVIASLGRLYDDGTHGDATVGDGTFTGQFTFSESSLGEVRLAVTAGYKGTLLRIRSQVIILSVLRRPSNEELQTTVQTQQDASQLFATLRAQFGDDAARSGVLNYLHQQQGVADTGISGDSRTIWIHYTSGINAIIDGNPIGTQGGSMRQLEPQFLSTNIAKTSRWNLPTLLVNSVASQNNTTFPTTARAIVLAPFFDRFSPNDASDYIAQHLSQACAPVQVVKNGSVTVNTMKTLNLYGVIFINTHGGVDGAGQVVMLTREEATLLNLLSHLGDLLTGRLGIGSAPDLPTSYFMITPAFVRYYAGGGFPNSVVFASACDTLNNHTLSDAFINNGAGTYFGWQDSVHVDFNTQIGQSLFDVLTDVNLAAADKTTGKAFDAIPNKIDPSTPHAVFMMAGSRDVALSDNLVINGGFERGDLSGWTPDNTFGYVTASIDDHTAGNYSGRIGRWDQPYMQGGCFRCGPVPGVEPNGSDFVYQDVDLPNDLTVTAYTLDFDYNLVTYDGADYDWFDMQVRDAQTNAVLLQPVNHVGGIIAGCTCNWGLFYTTGWRHVSVDLTPYRGRRVRLFYNVTQDGFGDQIATYIDQVKIECNH